jgi:hypothetical protein
MMSDEKEIYESVDQWLTKKWYEFFGDYNGINELLENTYVYRTLSERIEELEKKYEGLNAIWKRVCLENTQLDIIRKREIAELKSVLTEFFEKHEYPYYAKKLSSEKEYRESVLTVASPKRIDQLDSKPVSEMTTEEYYGLDEKPEELNYSWHSHQDYNEMRQIRRELIGEFFKDLEVLQPFIGEYQGVLALVQIKEKWEGK